jgi:hypothetical protein
MLSKNKTTFFIVLGIIVLFFVWNVFLKKPKEPEGLLVASSSNEEVEILGQPIVDGISKISKLKTGLNKTILTNPVFLSLTKEPEKTRIVCTNLGECEHVIAVFDAAKMKILTDHSLANITLNILAFVID